MRKKTFISQLLNYLLLGEGGNGDCFSHKEAPEFFFFFNDVFTSSFQALKKHSSSIPNLFFFSSPVRKSFYVFSGPRMHFLFFPSFGCAGEMTVFPKSRKIFSGKTSQIQDVSTSHSSIGLFSLVLVLPLLFNTFYLT